MTFVCSKTYFSLIVLTCIKCDTFPVKEQASNPWVAASNLTLVFLFISLVEFYTCIFGANEIDFKNFRTVVVVSFENPFMSVNIARCPTTP